MLCFGDSQVKFGLQPVLMEKGLGRRTYSLALYGGGPPASYYLLRRTIHSGAKPTAIVVNFEQGPLLCNHLDHPHARHWSELLGLRDCLDLAHSYKDANIFGRLVSNYALPSYRARFELRASLVAALKGASTSERNVSRFAMRNWRVNRGAQLNIRVPSVPG